MHRPIASSHDPLHADRVHGNRVDLLAAPAWMQLDEVQLLCRLCTRAGFGTVWLAEEGDLAVSSPGVPFDPWTALGELAQLLRGTRLGVLVGLPSLDPPLPVVLRAVTAQLVLQGGFSLGIGTGFSNARDWLSSVAVREGPHRSQASRFVGRMEPYIGRGSSRGATPDWFGPEIRVRPSLLLGGRSAALDAKAVRVGDAWIGGGRHSRIAERLARLRALGAAHGTRVPALAIAGTLIVRSNGEASRLRARAAASLRCSEAAIADRYVIGTVDLAASVLGKLRACGADRLVVEPLVPVARRIEHETTYEEQLGAIAEACEIASNVPQELLASESHG